jgi:hypothetical protein
MIGTIPEENNPDPDYTVRQKILNQNIYFDKILNCLMGGGRRKLCDIL